MHLRFKILNILKISSGSEKNILADGFEKKS